MVKHVPKCPQCLEVIPARSVALLYDDRIVEFCMPVCAVKWHARSGPKPSAPRLLLSPPTNSFNSKVFADDVK